MSTDRDHQGRRHALAALEGRQPEQLPVGVFTWGFDYYWRVAGLAPWQLACGGNQTWHRAHMAIYERHQPDLIWYSGSGGPADPTLLSETAEAWLVRDNNTNREYELLRDSLALRSLDTKTALCHSTAVIENEKEAGRQIPLFDTWGTHYLNGLRALITELNDRALVLPHHSPAYICACYKFGFERSMELMLTNPRLFIYTCDRYAEGDYRRMRELAQAGAQAVFIADGWASCDIISPAMFDRFALPYQRNIVEAAHKAGLKVILWNEGDVMPILDREADLPVDAFQTEQPRKGVNLALDKVRDVFGNKRCLCGNLDSEGLLKRNNHAEIREAVLDQLAMSGAGAPFILNTGSPIPSDVSPEAVDIMVRVAREWKNSAKE